MERNYTQHEMDERISFGSIAKDITYIKEQVGKIEAKLEKEYVTQAQFEPVKRIAYGIVSLILVAVVGALMALVLNK